MLLAAVAALCGTPPADLITEFILRPGGPGGTDGRLDVPCPDLEALWSTTEEARGRRTRWAGYALGDALWDNGSVAIACIAAGTRHGEENEIGWPLALEICRAADSCNFDEAAPEFGVAAAYGIPVSTVAGLRPG
jgi:hypothetical protein